MHFKVLILIFTGLLLTLTGCQFSVSSQGSNLGSIISGIATPFLGSIVQHQKSLLFTSSYAAVCADPVNAKLYELNADGSITEGQWVAVQTLGSGARYTFNLKDLGLSTEDATVKYMVKVEGCNGEVFKRPITDFDNQQDIDFKTTVVANIVDVDNATITRNLSEVSRSQIKQLMEALSGSSRTTALDSLTNDVAPSNLFTTIFGAPPAVILDSRPEVLLSSPTTNLQELLVQPFSVQTFHADPNYSFAYRWKLDGVVKSSSATWNYIPGANAQGNHQVEVFVGKNDGSNNIDTSKPYYYKAFYVTVDNNIMPTAPALALNAATPSPRIVDSVDIDINTGAGLANCDSFSELAISETNVVPSPIAFTIVCADILTQTETFTFGNTDGNKTLYLWARDADGNVSLPSTVNFVYDSSAPALSLTAATTPVRGGESYAFTYSSTDGVTGISSLVLQYAADGSTFSFVKNLSTSGTSDSMTLPSDNVATAKIRIVAADAAGNTSSVTSGAFTVDSILPVTPSMSLASSLYAQSKSVTLTAATCSADQNFILINESTQPTAADAGWVACTTTAAALTYEIPTNTEGLHGLKVWTKDLAGNVSTAAATVNMYLDLTAPVLTLSAVPTPIQGGSSQALTLTLTELHASNAQTISVEYFNGGTWLALGTKTITNGPHAAAAFTYNYTLPLMDTASAKLRASYGDLSGRTTIITTNTFVADSTAPVISGFSINGGAATTDNNNVQISFSMLDSITNITKFCLRYNDTTTPLAGDTCWRDVDANPPGLTQATSLSLVNYFWTIGFGAATYNVYAWAQDVVGNISTLSAAGAGTAGTDRGTIDFYPGTPPVMTNVLATNKNDPLNPPDRTADLTVPVSDAVYIKWTASDVEGLNATPISISYSVDDVNFTTVASNLINGANGGCVVDHASTSADDSATGCYVWSGGNPAGYFKIKVTALDTSGQASSSVSVPLNSGNINFLAGNTSVGLNSSATSAIFQNWIASVDSSDNGSLAITPSGMLFFLDPFRGLMRVNPTDGLLKLWIPKTGAYTGDGGLISAAALNNPRRIALTYDNKLLIRDCARIREIDLTTNIITTKIGGGGSSADGVSPTDVSLSCNGAFAQKHDILTALPNGDILFTTSSYSFNAGTTAKFRRYVAATDTVTSFTIGGTGHSLDATQDLSKCRLTQIGVGFNTANSQFTHIVADAIYNSSQPDCFVATSQHVRGSSFNPVTGLSEAPRSPTGSGWTNGDTFTGMDGRIYIVSRLQARIYRYTLTPTGAASDWQTLVGTGARGFCADGTVATACAIEPSAAFVSALGRVYFTDHGQIRFIDDQNKVQTMMGQRYSYGDGNIASSARFGTLESVAASNSGEIVVIDQFESRIRAFNPGGNISTIAGTGFNSTPGGLDAASTRPLLTSSGGQILSDIHVEPATGDVYYMPDGVKVSRLDRATDAWVYIIGHGATNYTSADGLTGVNVQSNNTARNRISSYHPASGKLFVHWSKDSGGAKDVMIKSYDRLNNDTQTHWSGQVGTPDGVCVSGTTLSENCSMPYGGSPNTQYDSVNDRLFYGNGNNIISILKPGSAFSTAVTLSNNARSFVYKKIGADEWIYYCDSTNNVLKKQRLVDATSTPLSWPSTSLKCAGNKSALRWHPVTGNLLFIYTQDNLYGVAEYVNP